MATGTSTSVPSPTFHSDDTEQGVEYRTLSVPAVIGLVLGLASPLCFGAPLLFVIPIAGLAISVFALQRIAVSDGSLAGRWAALTGLVLCSAMIVAPLSREYVIRRLRTQQAHEFAVTWLNLVVSGKAQDAFKLTIDSMRGAAPPEPGSKTPPVDPYDKFRSELLVKTMSAAGADADIQFLETVDYDYESFQRVFVQERFKIIPRAAKNDEHPVDVTLTLQHAQIGKEGRSRWMIWSIDDSAKASKPPATVP